jgi:KipI family sensor histidine kinase inhibitor
VAVYFGAEPQVDPGALKALAGLHDTGVSPRTVEIQAVYDGPDLAAVALVAGVSDDDVARIHAAGAYEVETMGFAPGFAYLTGVDRRLHLPRRTTPRPRVPAGSIALAGGFTGVYPFDSPGGWHLIGRVIGVRMFSEDGALLRLGDRVRFVR